MIDKLAKESASDWFVVQIEMVHVSNETNQMYSILRR